jgi:adenylate cyclase, class 2
MREIEIKARVRDEKSLLEQLQKQGIELGGSLKQHDVVFGQPGAADNEFGANWLRIRTQNDSTVYFTLKRSVVGHLDSIEHETIVDDAKELEEIIKLMGYELYSDLTKIRRKAKHGDLEICLDEVPSLGTFIEVEKIMQHDAEHDEVVAELWEFLQKLGISKEDEEHLGYDTLERQKRGL